MPIHDWTRATDAAYHAFLLDWSCRLSERLNHGVLPRPIYAMTETVELRPPAEFCPLPEPVDRSSAATGMRACRTQPHSRRELGSNSVMTAGSTPVRL